MDDIMNAELTDILKANNIEIPVSGGGGLQSIGPGMYLFTMPDGVDGRGFAETGFVINGKRVAVPQLTERFRVLRRRWSLAAASAVTLC